ncbi:MAG: ABC transporter substrate-binding protein [Clostridium sp.]|uniref:ABC transporter substrate-binding protein n=1 Tax=Clostridium sp. TaxID=1506 RepID=UPI003EE6F0C2
MSKRLRLLVLGVAVMAGSMAFVGCGAEEKSVEGNGQVAEKSESFKYAYDNGKEKVDVEVKEKPTKAVTLSQFMTEMLLSLDLGDKMVGTALLDNPILPEYKEAYDKIPVLEIADGHNISKEAFTALEPDFVSGWEMSIADDTTGTAKELVDGGAKPFVAKSLAGTSTIETVYEDYVSLGKIFGVEDKATEVINKMKAEVEAVKDKLKDVKEDKVNVLVYDSGEKDAMVVGSGLPNNLITLAGGNNIYGDLKNAYETVSFESIVEKNPDVILVTEFLAGDKAEDKIKFLKSHPALKDVNAIKNNKIFVVELADLSPGVRNSKVITKMNEIFYGNK